MKKIMITMLLTILSFNIANVTAASNEEVKVYEESINFVQNDFSERNSFVVFGEIDAKSETKIEYSYEEIELKDNSSLVVFNGFIDNQGEKLPIYAEGEIEKVELSNGDFYSSGSMRGTLIVNESIFEVTIGVSGSLDKEEVVFGVSVYTSLEKCYNTVLFLSFGEQFMNDEIEKILESPRSKTRIESDLVEDDKAFEDAIVSKNTNPYVYEGYDYAYQDPSITVGYQPQSGKLLRLRTYKDSINGRVGVALKSYTYNFDIDEFYSPSDPNVHTIIGAYIDRYEIGLKRLSPSGSFIVGMENLKSDNSTTNTLLQSMFKDFLGVFAPCSGTLSEILGQTRGSVQFDPGTNDYSVVVNVGSTYNSKLDFDDDDFYVVFQLSSNNNIITSYRAYATVTYFVYTDACLFVIDTEEAVESLGIVFD